MQRAPATVSWWVRTWRVIWNIARRVGPWIAWASQTTPDGVRRNLPTWFPGPAGDLLVFVAQAPDVATSPGGQLAVAWGLIVFAVASNVDTLLLPFRALRYFVGRPRWEWVDHEGIWWLVNTRDPLAETRGPFCPDDQYPLAPHDPPDGEPGSGSLLRLRSAAHCPECGREFFLSDARLTAWDAQRVLTQRMRGRYLRHSGVLPPPPRTPPAPPQSPG